LTSKRNTRSACINILQEWKQKTDCRTCSKKGTKFRSSTPRKKKEQRRPKENNHLGLGGRKKGNHLKNTVCRDRNTAKPPTQKERNLKKKKYSNAQTRGRDKNETYDEYVGAILWQFGEQEKGLARVPGKGSHPITKTFLVVKSTIKQGVFSGTKKEIFMKAIHKGNCS